ncbi:MAG: hypothetical protein Q8M17_12900 [Actinomycetota bacterium]|nr:hypothetical protein [Actinomycetota bacterium]
MTTPPDAIADVEPDDEPGLGSPWPVTYGELMDAARRHGAHAQHAIAGTALGGPDAAGDVLAARARLLGQIAHHAQAILGDSLVRAWRDGAPPRRGTDDRDPRMRSALAWLDTLTAAAGQPPASTPASTSPATAESGRALAAVDLQRACVLVAAASDLVATHRDPDGTLRPTGSPALGSADILGVLAAPARLAAMVGPVEPLALRCRQAGLPRTTIDDALPLGDPVTAACWDLAAAIGFPSSAVAPLASHNARPDTSSPAAEWATRLDRIATRLRAHGSRGRISARTLHDLATLGLVTSHVLATSTRHDPDPPTLRAPTETRVSEVTHRWQVLAAHLEPLRSAQPADRVIRGDVERLLAIAHPAATTNQVDRRCLLAAIHAGLPTLDACSAVADRLMTASTDAWVPAKPRRPYLPDLHRPGHAARPAPPAPTGFPRIGPTLT